MITGYLHPQYAQSLSPFGVPLELVRSEGWVLQRSIPDSAFHDAMGCYPIFCCGNWPQLEADLEDLAAGLVCLSVVTDPFGEYDPAFLQRCFRDVVIPFKEHFIIDLSRPLETFAHPHHRRNARKALRELQIEKCACPADFLDSWTVLYRDLVTRHAISGITAFSRESFAGQLRVPGIVAFRAIHNDVTVGMLLWYEQGNRAYYHLGAYSLLGYDLGASFALFDFSIQYFAEHGFVWLNLGAGAGAGVSGDSGLTRFKRGWSTGLRTAYFCGRVFDQTKYQEIVNVRHVPPTNYFPAYRLGEFV